MQEYAVGTKEYFVVEVTDRLENLTTLDPYTITFDVKEKRTGDDKYTDASASNEGMSVLCLLDTSGWDVGRYLLWTTIVAEPESPRLGPFEFELI